MTFTSHSQEQTFTLGRRIGALAAPPLFIALHGDMGAGKTHLVRGIAQGARVADPDLVSSPTYVICNIYQKSPHDPQSKTVFHLDAYRTNGEEDFSSLGFEEILQQEGIVVVEWAARIPELLPADHLAIAIEPLDESTRRFNITATGPASRRVLEQFAAP